MKKIDKEGITRIYDNICNTLKKDNDYWYHFGESKLSLNETVRLSKRIYNLKNIISQ